MLELAKGIRRSYSRSSVNWETCSTSTMLEWAWASSSASSCASSITATYGSTHRRAWEAPSPLQCTCQPNSLSQRSTWTSRAQSASSATAPISPRTAPTKGRVSLKCQVTRESQNWAKTPNRLSSLNRHRDLRAQYPTTLFKRNQHRHSTSTKGRAIHFCHRIRGGVRRKEKHRNYKWRYITKTSEL